MDPVHLRSYELNYELRIRDVTTDRVDITLKRKFLRRELRKDLARPNVHVYQTPNFDFDVEKRELEESIASISDLVNNFDGVNSELGLRIRSRINHVLDRIRRIPENISDDISNYRGDNIIVVSALEEDLSDITERHQRGEELGRATRVHGTTTADGSKFVSVYKWAIKFSGRSDKGSLHSFLQHVEELRVSRRCTKEGLFESASDLFEDFALEWYRAQLRQNRFDSWDSLVSALKSDFLSSEYDDELWKNIEKRTQSVDEPVVIYISIMENLFDYLSEKPSEEKKLRILKARVLPQYQSHLALQNITSVKGLVTTCRLLEESERIKNSFQTSSNKNISILEPVLAYDTKVEHNTPGPSSCPYVCCVPDRQGAGSCHSGVVKGHCSNTFVNRNGNVSNHNTGNVNRTSDNCFDFNSSDHRAVVNHRKKSQNNKVKQVTEIHCWKCNAVGHLQRDCGKVQGPQCYGCGRKNVIRPNCPSCSKNGKKERGK